MAPRASLLSAVAAAALVVGCSSSRAPLGDDADAAIGADADADLDTRIEADAAPDTETAPDAAAETEVGADAAADAESDAGSDADAALPVELPPGLSWCDATGCAGAPIDVVACPEGSTDCAPTRRTTVGWAIDGRPFDAMAVLVRGTGGAVTPVVHAGSASIYWLFAIARGASALSLGADVDVTLSYWNVAPVWGGATALDLHGSTLATAHGRSSFFRFAGWDAGVDHATLAASIEKLAADEIGVTAITPPAHRAFLMPTDMAIVLGGEGNWSFGDGSIAINYGNPDWIAANGGVAAIVAHEFAHEHAHTLFAQIASKFTGDATCLNEGLADALGNFVGGVPDVDLATAQDGSDFTKGCTLPTEIHAKGNCVFWNLKQAGYFRGDVFAKLFAPAHTYSFSSCDMTATSTGNTYVVMLTEATGVDMSSFVTGIGLANAGSYAAAKAALGI